MARAEMHCEVVQGRGAKSSSTTAEGEVLGRVAETLPDGGCSGRSRDAGEIATTLNPGDSNGHLGIDAVGMHAVLQRCCLTALRGPLSILETGTW